MKIHYFTLRNSLLVAIALVLALVSCKKVDTLFFGKYYLSVDANTQHGKVYMSTDNTTWLLLSTKDTIVKEGNYYFKAEPEAGYQFADWGSYATLLGSNAISAPIAIKENIVFAPTFTQQKNEYTIALGTINIDANGNGTIEYSIDNGVTYKSLTTKPITFPANTSILFRAVPTTDKFFWQWDEGISGYEENPPAVTLNADLVVSATFGDYKRTNVALIPKATNGYIRWRNNTSSSFTPLKTTAPYDSVPAGTTIYFEAVPNLYYQVAPTNSWTINAPLSFVQSPTDELTQVSAKITQKATITANFQILTYTVHVVDPGNDNTITYNTDGGSTYTATPSYPWIVNAGTTLYFKATPHTAISPYYRFAQWTDDLAGNNMTTTSITIAKNTTISAAFIRQYQITVAALPTGATDFKVNTTGATTPASTPTSIDLPAGNTGYIDSGTTLTATATPITTDPNYYRFKNWDGTTLTGKPSNGTNISHGTNISNVYTPTADMTIPAPTFQQQYQLAINLLNTNGSFNTGTTPLASVAGNQPVTGAATTWLQSNTTRLTGYFDAGTIISINSSPNPAVLYKIRYSYDALTNQKLNTYTINNNTTLTGIVSILTLQDIFPVSSTVSTRSVLASGEDGHFAKAYTYAEGNGMGEKFAKLSFTIDAGSDNIISNIKIENTATTGTYSGRSDMLSPSPATPRSNASNEYRYTLTSTTAIGNSGIGTPLTLLIKLSGSTPERIDEITLTDNTPTNGGTITFNPIYAP